MAVTGTGWPPFNITQQQREPLNVTRLLPRLVSTAKPSLETSGRTWVPFSTTTVGTNMSTAEPPHRSGIVPGIIAASLFISFLLCLYAILWKCMVTMPKRQMKRQSRRRPPPGLLPEKTLC